MSISHKIYTGLRGDKTIWSIVVLLALVSTFVVYSAGGSFFAITQGISPEGLLMKHVGTLAIGFVVMYIAYLLPYQRYKTLAPWLLLLSVVLLVYTLANGVEINGARRWIRLPLGVTLQTSDLAKVALVLFVADRMTRFKDYIQDFQKAFLPLIVPILLVCVLVMPSDLSTAVLLFVSMLFLLWIGRVNWKYLVSLVMLGLVMFSFVISLGLLFPNVIRVDTWAERIKDFVESENIPSMDSDAPLEQIDYARMAIAHGGFFGRGPGKSTMRNFLPASYSDFVYAILLEEYGFVGGLFVLGLYVLLLFRVIKLVTLSSKSFGAMAAMGLTIVLVLQAFSNMAVSVHLIPVTGLTLPVISKGGTSILFTCFSLGIILSVSRYVERQHAVKRAES